jgi:SAM-dependent MidA family methyltransferase
MLSLGAEIKKLTMPHEMGELFKVIALSKDIDEQLIGFRNRNQSGRLVHG